MITKRIFYVVYFADVFVQSCLDLIRYLAEWSEKTPAHITVRGPYSRRLHEKVEQSLDEQMAGIDIDVLGVSAFLNQRQNTVYLRCSASELSQVWHKPNYSFNPHLTLYDGNDRPFADELLAGLNLCAKQFAVKARGVDYIVSIKGERVLPTTRLSIEIACQRLGIIIDKDTSEHNHREARLEQILHVYQALQDYCTGANDSAPATIHDPAKPESRWLCEVSAEHLPPRPSGLSSVSH